MGSVRGHTVSDLAHELQGPAVPMIITLMFVQIVFGILMGLGVNGGMRWLNACNPRCMRSLAAVVRPWHVDGHD